MINDQTLDSYPMMAITNLAMNPDGAVAAASHVSKLLSALKSFDSSNLKSALSTIIQITSEPKALALLTPETINDIITTTRPFWDTENAKIIFKILDSIGVLEAGKEAIKNSDFPTYALNQLKKVEITHALRPMFLRIISRIDIDLSVLTF